MQNLEPSAKAGGRRRAGNWGLGFWLYHGKYHRFFIQQEEQEPHPRLQYEKTPLLLRQSRQGSPSHRYMQQYNEVELSALGMGNNINT
ncbi:hypothetical protein L6164_015762 [Bauhinia variegata]|uniref:Uncharacterized protein n=1 Tax=Bauhinia variegata TaxID=167791 RepID=A0ACB9NMW7_BAUVA|nr:hypothetical protein L6164_015762 [Bauhinia variegata]